MDDSQYWYGSMLLSNGRWVEVISNTSGLFGYWWDVWIIETNIEPSVVESNINRDHVIMTKGIWLDKLPPELDHLQIPKE